MRGRNIKFLITTLVVVVIFVPKNYQPKEVLSSNEILKQVQDDRVSQGDKNKNIVAQSVAFMKFGVSSEFEFRDENNKRVSGNTSLMQELFQTSAFNLLMMGLTQPKVCVENLLASNPFALGKFILRIAGLGKKLVAAIASTSMRVFFKLRLSGSMLDNLSSNLVLNAHIPNAPLLTFRGSPLVLRL
ncbi:hypothetical protein ACFL6Y_08125 [Elusimicrobiota bacterium]